jgi:uncharacterized protein YndB with AHSA1/START domain
MRQVTVAAYISAPREQIFDFVNDLAGRPAFTDHYQRDFRLARVRSVGVGAAARFVLKVPFGKQYAEATIVESDRPRRIVESVAIGRRGRNRGVAVYEFMAESGGTRVELTTFAEPATIFDRRHDIGAAGWMRRRTRTALDRLRAIFEEPPKEPLARATIAGFESAKAARFGVHPGGDPARAPR